MTIEEDVKGLITELESEIEALKNTITKEREQHDAILGKLDNLTRESSSMMKEHNAKVKKFKEQFKKEAKVAEKKDKNKAKSKK
jgi:Mg2+ and Co2+ transporter CorA